VPDRREQLRALPAIDKLLATPALANQLETQPHALVVEAAQTIVAALRRQILDESAALPDLHFDRVAAMVAEEVAHRARPSLRRVVNVTGTLLHTNLGRAPLCDAALTAIAETARGYSNLEYDLDRGQRGKRFRHVEALICQLTGGEAATVVNNNAGAVMLCLAALAAGRTALVSRGELIEIGGSFRIPEIMAASGVRLVEVGTTNKTHLADYQRAIDTETALILKVHTSNYRILGFTEAVSGDDLAALGRQHGLPVLEDLGSGLLFDLSSFGLPREPTVGDALKTGIDLLTFSGDKLLGGPQAGIIVGKSAVIETVRNHPMARALRIDKLTLAALEATLRLYRDPQQALQRIPTLAMLAQTETTLKARCEALLPQLLAGCGDQVAAEIVPTTATVGGGALPLAELAGWAVALTPQELSLQTLTSRLRQADPPVVGRIQDDRFLIDPRTLSSDDTADLLLAFAQALAPESTP
jgi:L-seryl-tRNA(Ser) seleniumtransferase